MATDSIETRATVNGFTGVRLMVAGSASLEVGLLVLLKPDPQAIVLLVQVMWAFVLVV